MHNDGMTEREDILDPGSFPGRSTKYALVKGVSDGPEGWFRQGDTDNLDHWGVNP